MKLRRGDKASGGAAVNTPTPSNVCEEPPAQKKGKKKSAREY